MIDTIWQHLSLFACTVLCISDIIMQINFVITGALSSLFLVFVIFCLHESLFVYYLASRKVQA